MLDVLRRQRMAKRAVAIAEADEKRQVIAYPELGWSVEHRRTESIDAAEAPGWMSEGLAAGS